MSGNNGDEHQRKIEAGEVEKVKASEEVIKRNITSMMMHGNETRKAVIELRTIVDALQAKMVAQEAQLVQMRTQLATLQGEFYRRGTTSYADAPEETDDTEKGAEEGRRISHP